MSEVAFPSHRSTSAAATSLAGPGAALAALQRPIPATRFPSVCETFRAAAERWHDRLAIESPGRRWTYGELRDRVGLEGRRLAAAGVGRGDVVALVGPSCADFVAVFLAGLGSGAALLPIDLAVPPARRDTMVRLARATFVVSVAASGDVTVARTGREARPLPAGAAYIFFTSGTTGEPKAILGTHNGLAHFLDWQRRAFAIEPGIRCAQLIALSFDPVLRDILLPLTSGASLHVPDAAHGVASGRTLEWLASERISLIHSVPSLARSWLAAAGHPVVPSLRYTFFSGEPLDAQLVERWRAATSPTCRVVNLYGPTETTMVKAWYEVGLQPAPGRQPAGQALPESELFVMDGKGRPCEAGEVGEVIIRTPHRTFGYLDNAAEQRKRFTRNPHGADPDDLLYATGDRGCFGPDGLLQVLGRMDDQLKVHGVRVEPAEIEWALTRLPGIAQAGVYVEHPLGAAEDQDGRLAAAVVPWNGSALDYGRVRAHLSALLPSAAIPSTVVVIDRLPLNTNGKVDRSQLPVRAAAGRPLACHYVAPRTQEEVQLSEIWKALLPGSSGGRHDDFFASGGDSLLAVRLCAAIDAAFGLRLAPSVLLEAPTIEQLAERLAARESARPHDPLVVLRARGSRPPLFCVHPIGGEAICYRELAEDLGEDQPVYGLAADARALEGRDVRLEELAASYLRTIQRVQPHGPYVLGGFSFGATLAFEMARQVRAAGEPVALLALFDGTARALRRPSPARVARNLFRAAPYWLLDDARNLAPRQNLERVLRKWRLTTWQLRSYLAGAATVDAGMPDEIMKLRFPGYHIPLVRTLQAAAARYRPQPYDGRVTLFRSRALPLLSAEDPEEGWRALAAGGVQVHLVPGSHTRLLKKPAVTVVARRLRTCLDAVLADPPPAHLTAGAA